MRCHAADRRRSVLPAVRKRGINPDVGSRGITRHLAFVVRLVGLPLLALAVAAVVTSSRGASAHPPRGALSDVPPSDDVPPPDGKYENVMVEGRVVPMVHVMNGGTVVLVDADGKKPRTWEEQFKRKGDLPSGTYNLHKTNMNGNETFADDPVDREGLWAIDAHANITAR